MNPFGNWSSHDVEAFNARVAAAKNLAVGVDAPTSIASAVLAAPSPAGNRPDRLRQNHAPKMNQTEGRWFSQINCRFPNYPPVRAHAKTFLLANGVRYTPDFSASLWPFLDDRTGETTDSARETCWEVKGPHAWDDALVKIKFAAHEWPEIHWLFVWEDYGIWTIQTVLP